RRNSPELCMMPALSRYRGRREGRVTAAPGALAPKTVREGRVTTGTADITPAFPALWFTAYSALSSVNLADCHRPRRDAKHHRQVSASLWGARTTRFRRPPPWRSSTATSASTAPRLTFVTTANRPSVPRRDGDGSDYRKMQGRRDAADYRDGLMDLISRVKLSFARTAINGLRTISASRTHMTVRRLVTA